jgi:hypothetical protein
LHTIIVEKRQPRNSQGSQLNGNLSADGTHADYHGIALRQAFRRH